MIKEARWSGWVWVGECSFWYRPTRVVPDQRPLNGRCCCCNWRLNANVICWFFVDLAEIPDGYLQVRIETNACDSLFSLFFGLLLTYVHLLEHLWGKVTVPVLQATPTVDSKVLESALCTNSDVGWIMKACSVVQALVKPAKCPAFYICLVFSYWMVTCLTTWIML